MEEGTISENGSSFSDSLDFVPGNFPGYGVNVTMLENNISCQEFKNMDCSVKNIFYRNGGMGIGFNTISDKFSILTKMTYGKNYLDEFSFLFTGKRNVFCIKYAKEIQCNDSLLTSNKLDDGSGLKITYTLGETVIWRETIKVDGFEMSEFSYANFKNAIVDGNYELIQLILKESSIDPTYNNNFAIQYSSKHGNDKIVDLLLKDGRSDPTSENNYAFEYAVKNNHYKVVELLLKDGRVDPSYANNFAIRQASNDGSYNIVDLLLKDGRVDPTANKSFSLRISSENGHDKIVDLLLKDGRSDPKANDNHSLRMAATNGHDKVVDLLLKDRRANPSYKNSYALRKAIEKGYDKIVKLLIDDGRSSVN